MATEGQSMCAEVKSRAVNVCTEERTAQRSYQ